MLKIYERFYGNICGDPSNKYMWCELKYDLTETKSKQILIY